MGAARAPLVAPRSGLELMFEGLVAAVAVSLDSPNSSCCCSPIERL